MQHIAVTSHNQSQHEVKWLFDLENGRPQPVLKATRIKEPRVLKVPYGHQSMCKQICKHLVRSTLYILMYLLIFSQSNS